MSPDLVDWLNLFNEDQPDETPEQRAARNLVELTVERVGGHPLQISYSHIVVQGVRYDVIIQQKGTKK